MAHPLPDWQNGKSPDTPKPDDQDVTMQESQPVPLWLAHLHHRKVQQRAIPPDPNTSITIELDKAAYEALSHKARATGSRISDVINAALQREIGNKPQVITLMQRWNLHREDLDRAAGALGVEQLTETEWGQIGIRRVRRG
ncbi:hypothetical protein ACFYSC_34665 [Streptosporangium sp. NPDC004379]|uniref:hypothetical protein n=1 Tax=Streptosporangium sp. NPDC004379 TaxID=3366189 RepID=UPI00369798A1